MTQSREEELLMLAGLQDTFQCLTVCGSVSYSLLSQFYSLDGPLSFMYHKYSTISTATI